MPSEKPVRPLHTLAYGETAVITSMYLHGAIRQRLQDLGSDHRHQPSARLHTAGGGDPTAYAVRGGVVALRKCDAKMILVQ